MLARVNPVCWLMECPLCDGMRYVMCSSAATMHNCGNQASLGSFITALPMQQPPPGYSQVLCE